MEMLVIRHYNGLKRFTATIQRILVKELGGKKGRAGGWRKERREKKQSTGIFI